jgi:pimeloyl-ACP methyl ester carboxylesterase
MSNPMEALFEHRIDVAGHSTRAFESAGEGPGIVLLHGWGDAAEVWLPVLAELSARERRAIAVDLPGFGRATALKPGAVLPQLDAFAAELVRGWSDGEPVVVAGSSLGGCLALRLAEQEAVELAGVVPMAPDGLEAPAWFDAIEEDPIVRKLLSLPLPVPNALIRDAARGAYDRLALQDANESQRAVVDALAKDAETRALMASGRGLLPELSAAPFDLVGIRCPVLLVWGDHDRMLPHTGARIVLGSLPTTQVELIEGCGPRPQLEAPDRLLELLLPFPY